MPELTTTTQIINGLMYLGSDTFKGKLTKALMQEALEQVDRGFVASRDPYGRSWKPVQRGGQPLRDTGRLQRSFHRGNSSDAGGFRIGSNVEYANVHQFGHTFKASTRHTSKKGQFKSKTRASGDKSRSSRIRFIGERVVDPRPMLPDGDLGPIWTLALEKAAQLVADQAIP